jgi:acyl-CoA reductase-like NAD-dependent aldehyde dehydrogenase
MLTAVPSEGLDFEGTWRRGSAEAFDVFDPATGEVFARIPLAGGGELDAAVQSASAVLEEHADEIAPTTKENGKSLAESRVELQRGI